MGRNVGLDVVDSGGHITECDVQTTIDPLVVPLIGLANVE